VDSYMPCMYVLSWIWTTNLFVLQLFPITVRNSWELEDLAVYSSSRWLIRPIYFTMKLIFSDSWAQSWACLFFLESRILHFFFFFKSSNLLFIDLMAQTVISFGYWDCLRRAWCLSNKLPYLWWSCSRSALGLLASNQYLLLSYRSCWWWCS
jgi:hypothetical protein